MHIKYTCHFLVFGYLLLGINNKIFSSEYKWGSNVRYRWKTDTSDEVIKNELSSYSEMRARINLQISGENVSAYFSLQDSRIFGETASNSGITNSTISPSFYQAFFRTKFLGSDIQLGRFELAFGNQRIIAKNNWNNYGRSFDGLLIRNEGKFGTSHTFYLPIIENYSTEHKDSKDNVLEGVYYTIPLKFLSEKSTIEPYVITYQDNSSDLSYYMLGLRADLEKKLFLLECEAALQNNDKKSITAALASLNMGYNFKNIPLINSIILGVDYISGDDTTTTDKMEGFSKYFGARHKHHGYYDYSAHKKFFGHEHTGLLEYNLKGKFNLGKRSKILFTFHDFNSHIGNVKYGQEIDIIIKSKINDEISSELGCALYMPHQMNETLTFYYFMLTANL